MRVVRVIAWLFLELTTATAVAGRDSHLSSTSLEEEIHVFLWSNLDLCLFRIIA
jgi:hypothetical protein